MKNKLIQQLQILMKQQNITEHKEAFYSSYGVTSSKAMTEEQLQDAIVRLGGKPTQGREKVNADVRYLRSQVLKVLTSPSPSGLNIPNDWDTLNKFIKDRQGKLLSKMTIEELKKFKKQLHSIRDSGWSYKRASPTTAPAQVIYCVSGHTSNQVLN